jgi:Cu-processing system permease protein
VTVVRLTLRETANRKVLLAGAIISVAFIGLFWVAFSFGSRAAAAESPTQVPDAAALTLMTVLGLYAVQFLAAFMAVLLSSGAIASEIDSGRLLAVLARPLSRRSWLAQRAGTFGGLAAGYVAGMTAVVLAIAAGVAGYGPLDPLRAIALLVLEVLVLVCLGTALSTRLSALASGIVVIALYGMAWLAGIMEVVGRAFGNAALERIAVAVSLVMPSDAMWRAASYYLQSPIFLAAQSGSDDVAPFLAVAPPSAAMLAWAVLYAVACAAYAARTFGRRDL